MVVQLNCSTARRRPALPMDSARAGSARTLLRRSAMSAAKRSGARAPPAPSLSNGTSRPVSPLTTTSGLPPGAGATTAVSPALDRAHPAGLAVDAHLGDAAGGGRDHRRLAGHRLQVDDPQGLVDRRADEHRGGGEERGDRALLQ